MLVPKRFTFLAFLPHPLLCSHLRKPEITQPGTKISPQTLAFPCSLVANLSPLWDDAMLVSHRNGEEKNWETVYLMRAELLLLWHLSFLRYCFVFCHHLMTLQFLWFSFMCHTHNFEVKTRKGLKVKSSFSNKKFIFTKSFLSHRQELKGYCRFGQISIKH